MSALKVLAISGSPSRTSKTAHLADAILRRMELVGIEAEHVMVRDLDPQALLAADTSEPSITDFIDKVAQAHGIVIATPIYKASFSGLLKSSLDILPQFAFAGKVIMPIGSGGSLAHVLALDYGLRPVLQSLAARHIVQSHFVLDADLARNGSVSNWEEPHLIGLQHAIANFLHSLTDDVLATPLGHPKPERHIEARSSVNSFETAHCQA